MKHLLTGLILICLMSLTACSEGRKTWEVWEITCRNTEGYDETTRFEGDLRTYDSGWTLYPKDGGSIKYTQGNACVAKYLGKGGGVR